jgi:hypothetical protein
MKRINFLDMLLVMIVACLLFAVGAWFAVHSLGR